MDKRCQRDAQEMQTLHETALKVTLEDCRTAAPNNAAIRVL